MSKFTPTRENVFLVSLVNGAQVIACVEERGSTYLLHNPQLLHVTEGGLAYIPYPLAVVKEDEPISTPKDHVLHVVRVEENLVENYFTSYHGAGILTTPQGIITG